MQFLGVKIDNITEHELMARVANMIVSGGFSHVSTVNPEFILHAQDNERFRSVLNSCDMNEIDGVGISYGLFLHGKQAHHRVPGVDLVNYILTVANVRKQRVYLVANKYGLSSWRETANALKHQYARIDFGGIDIDPHDEVLWREIPTDQYDVILCGIGAPYQEYLISHLKNEHPGSVKLAIGIGGTFDFMTGKIERAPRMVRKMGLEWLWRLVEQPKRIRREIRKLTIYPLLVLFGKLPSSFLSFFTNLITEWRAK